MPYIGRNICLLKSIQEECYPFTPDLSLWVHVFLTNPINSAREMKVHFWSKAWKMFYENTDIFSRTIFLNVQFHTLFPHKQNQIYPYTHARAFCRVLVHIWTHKHIFWREGLTESVQYLYYMYAILRFNLVMCVLCTYQHSMCRSFIYTSL